LTSRLPKKDSGQTKMNFKKPREVFVHNGMKKEKAIFHIFHRCHQLGESKPSFIPFFQVFGFSCFSLDFAGAVSAKLGDEFGETKGGFCPEHSHIQ
jgi:hypothetical protein